MQISPAGLSKRTTTAAPAKERTPGPYKSLNNTLDLADRIGIKATIETTKTLEQCIVDQYMDGPWSKSTNYLSDDEGCYDFFPFLSQYLSRTILRSHQPRHLPFHCHTSLHYHLPTWLFLILLGL